MRRFVEGIDRGQATLFPEYLEDWIDADNPVRVIDAFVDKLDLSGLGFDGVAPEATGRPSYHPSVLLKLYSFTRRGWNGARRPNEPFFEFGYARIAAISGWLPMMFITRVRL
jgi:hypothetical protein